MITHNASPISVPINNPSSLEEQRALLHQLRRDLIARYRPHLQDGPGPIRVMARIVAELEQECRQRTISQEVITEEIVNRTIGDIDVRQIVECEGMPGGPTDYRTLADELGVALPGENIHGYRADGETYLWLRNQMLECERLLLANHYDPRSYDIYGVGNPLLRTWLTQAMQQWGIHVPVEQLYLAQGAMDGIDKVLRGLSLLFRSQHITDYGILFPEPGFGVPEWQARSHGYQLHHFNTLPENRFKLTAPQLDELLLHYPDIRVIYLTITNNPTAFGYSASELIALHTVLRRYRNMGRTITLLADLAYIGTGRPEEDRARMMTFSEPEVLQHSIFVSSFSKTHSLTGERFGWITIGDAKIAASIASIWTNTMASLPGEWQLRFMAYMRLMAERPWLSEKLRAFYRLRRQRFVRQLQHIDAQQHLFKEIYLDDDATVYNWSRLITGEDAFSLFEKSGIAGVPGSGFGYSDEYVRFSIGVIPVPEV